MANSKLNSMPDYTARLPKTPHDLSQSFGFTTCPGQILPVYFDMLHHGDEIHFSASEFVRLNPLETAALGEIELHLDHYFVPLPVMYTPSSSMFYQTDDLLSSLVDKSRLNSSSFPVIKLGFTDETVTQSWFTQFDNQYFLGPFVQNGAGISPVSLNNEFFDCFGMSVLRMFDALRMNPAILGQSASVRSHYPAFTPWFALAYQAIYQLSPQFRNTDREVKNYHYNIDSFYNSGIITENLSTRKSIFNINYCQKHKDYFNSVKVSPMGSAVSMLGNPSDVFQNVNDWLNVTSINSASNAGTSVSDFASSTQVLGNTSYSSAGFMTSNSIRQLFMVDKLLRIIGRTEKNYESQFLAHYGIKVPHDPIHNITHIGHDMAVLQPQTVVSSADTFNGETGSALGEIGGQGSKMLSGKKYNFKAPFHGVFMTLAYIIPRTRYVAGLDKLHQLSNVTDFWQPEFDKKGMQPLFAYERNDSTYNMTNRDGWQFAYEQFKRRYDYISLAFMPTGSENENSYSKWFISTYPFANISRSGVASPLMRTLDVSDFMVSPCALNGVMQILHDTKIDVREGGFKPWLAFQTDPFICDFNMYCKKVNGMSATGEPELDC